MGVRAVLLLGMALMATACGYKGAVTRLEPPDPALTREEQKAARAEERRMVDAGLTVPAAARPIRVDELTVKLEVRRDDPFSLPPEGTQTSRKVPFPGEEVDPDDRPLPRPADTTAQSTPPQER